MKAPPRALGPGSARANHHEEDSLSIRRLMLAALAAVTIPAAPAQARHFTVQSTAYCPGSSGSIMASGRHVYFGAVANNFLPLGARIRVDRPIFGRRWFRVEDRIGWGSQLDVWMPSCSSARAWGRRSIGFSTR